MSVQITVPLSDRLLFDDTLSLLNASQEYYDEQLLKFTEGTKNGGWLWSTIHLKKVIQTALGIEFAYNRMHENDDVRTQVEFIMDPVTHVWSYNIAPYERKED